MTAMNLLRIPMILGCVLAGTSIGTAVQALRIISKPMEFRSEAIIVVSRPGGIREDRSTEPFQDYYGSHLESSEMKHRASDRVKALNPDLKEVVVDIRAAEAKSGGIVNILATGPEPRYTQKLLDALLDEYIAFQMTIQERAAEKTARPQDSVAVQQRASPPTAFVDWRQPVAMGAIAGGLLGALIGLVLSLLLVSSPKPPQRPRAAG